MNSRAVAPRGNESNCELRADKSGFVEIESPEGVHVVDHVTHTWLPRAPRPFVVDDPDHARLHLRA